MGKETDTSYYDKVSNNLKQTVGADAAGLSNSAQEISNVASNDNLSTGTKAAAITLNAAEAGVQAFGAITGAIDNAIEGAILPALGALGMAGIATLPISKQMDPVMGIDIHFVTIPPSPAPIPMPHPYIGMLFRAKDFVSAAIASVIPPPPAPPEVADPDAPTNDEQKALNVNKAANIGHMAATMLVGMLGATVKVGGIQPRAVAGTPTKSIPHIPMGAGFYPAVAATIQKNQGHAFLGSLFTLADEDPLCGGTAHLHLNCNDVGTPSPHDVRPSKNTAKDYNPLINLYLPTGVVNPIPPSRTILTNPVPTPMNPITAVKQLFKASLGKFLKNRRKKTETTAVDSINNRKSQKNKKDECIYTGKTNNSKKKKKSTEVTPDPPFKKNPKHSDKEYKKQLGDQQDAINKMPVKEWLKNREEFVKRDKKDYNKKAKKARDEYRKQEIDRRTKENLKNGVKPKEKAKQDAVKSMKGKAVLHNPDGVAGGKVDGITGVGDSKVNSSIGSQWRHGRAESIEAQVKSNYGIPPNKVDNIPDGDLMNVKLF